MPTTSKVFQFATVATASAPHIAPAPDRCRRRHPHPRHRPCPAPRRPPRGEHFVAFVNFTSNLSNVWWNLIMFE
jgi:hypothetical protein